MDVFTLAASIVLNTGDYEKGLDGASQKTSSFGDKIKNGLAAAAKAGAAAMAAATAAVTAFAGASIKTGAQFDSAMSQVAATMGTTVDEIGNLRDFAMEMGAKTAFSANEAAEALNYMALAGYSADESMEALPNVLNLAAAGGIELAAASDMVTDAQSALGLSMEESANLVDQMAMASSKSNTSVAQLGEAILTVGGTAKNLAGGTTELSTALGILADNGVKGAEGGTALRNIILSLSAPTDTAAKAMESLGLKVFDAEGNMRPLNETFGDLEAALSTMTQGEKTQVLSEIFNKVDLKSVDALLANTGERFDELSGYIDNAAGSAEKMANTQLDNLNGDITLFKSALEGAQIVISDRLTPKLREFVQFGSAGISKIATAFQEGGLSGAMGAFGTVLSDGLNIIVSNLPMAVDAGMQLLGALGQGMLDNLPVITDAGVEILMMLVNGAISALPNLVSASAEIIATIANGIASASPELVPAAIAAIILLVEALTDPGNLDNLIDAAIAIIMALADGLIESVPVLIEKAPEIVKNLVTALIENAPKLLAASLELVIKLGAGLVAAIPELLGYVIQLPAAIIGGIRDGAKDIGDVGKDIVSGLWEGIKSMGSWIKDKVSGFFGGIVDDVKGLLGIHSPSKVFREEVGQYIALGVAEGIDDKADEAVKAADKMAKDVYSRSKDWADKNTKYLKLSYGEQVELWETIQSQFVQGSKQWADAEEEIFDLREKAADEYQKNLTSRTNEILSWYSLFDEVPEKTKKSGDDLLKNLQDQVDGISNFFDKVSVLAERDGVGQALVEEIKGMGPKAIDELDALLALSDEKLAEYGSLFEQKTNLAGQYAAIELGGGFETANVDFASSAVGQSSAAIVNSVAGGGGANLPTIQLAINLLTGDARAFAQWILPDLIAAADAAGTPIASGQYA